MMTSKAYAKMMRQQITSSLPSKIKKLSLGTKPSLHADVAIIMNLITIDAVKIANAGANMHKV